MNADANNKYMLEQVAASRNVYWVSEQLQTVWWICSQYNMQMFVKQFISGETCRDISPCLLSCWRTSLHHCAGSGNCTTLFIFRQYITFKVQHIKRQWRAVNTCRLTADVTSDDAWKERTSKNMFPWFFFPHIFSCISPLYLRWEGLRHKETTQVSKARRHLRQIRSNHCGLYRSINATPFSLPLSARWKQNRESH